MKKLRVFFIHFLVTLLAIQGAVAVELLRITPAYAADPEPRVVINEVMWMGSYNGSTTNNTDEWIELFSPTGTIVGEGGLTLQTGTQSVVIPAGTELSAGDYYLIANQPAVTARLVSADLTVETAANWLPNDCAAAAISLTDETSAVIDSVGCNEDNWFAGVNDTDQKIRRSMERKVDLADGSLASSWQSSELRVNILSNGHNYASPKAGNEDLTAPIPTGPIYDGGQYLVSTSALGISWPAFIEEESEFDHYNVWLGTTVGAADVVSPVTTTDLSYTFSGLTLGEGATYYASVSATNTVGLVSDTVTSDGVTVNTVDPETPTNLAVADVDSDNGDSLSVSFDGSASLDVVSYQINYRQVGQVDWTTANIGSALSYQIDGLENYPKEYEVTVEAVDFNNQHSAPTAPVSGQARDNLAPVLDQNRVVVNQNRPGSADSLYGTTQAVNEANSTVNVFDRHPAQTGAVLINSVMVSGNGSFDSIGLGDNQHATVWVQVVDQAGNASQAAVFSNDIVGPTAPVLNKLTATCVGDPCRTRLEWTAGSTDSASYQVRYSVNDAGDYRSLEVTGTSLDLDLPTERSYQLRVVAFDRYGNESAASNTLAVRLTQGVKAIVSWDNNQALTTTEAIEGAQETLTAPVSPIASLFVPRARAAEPSVEPTPTPQPTEPTTASDDTQTDAAKQDWVRVLTIVVLLLVVAGTFYVLARAMNNPAPVETAPVVAAPPTTKRRKSANGGKAKGTTKKRSK